MKRAITLIMSLAMVFSLVACGSNADQPSSSSTPPVTQGNQNQPTNPDNTQPSEPSDNTPNEPQGSLGNIPTGAILLYDGIHYLSLPQVDEFAYQAEFCYVAITGTQIQKESVKIEHEAERGTGGIHDSIILSFGGTEPLSEQIVSVTVDGEDRDVSYFPGLSNDLASGASTLLNVAGVEVGLYNFTDASQLGMDCYATSAKFIATQTTQSEIAIIDGQEIGVFSILDDLTALFGAPTAAFGTNCGMDVAPDFKQGGGEICYIWKFNDFAILVPGYVEVYEDPSNFSYTYNAEGEIYMYRFTDSDNITVFPQWRQGMIDTLSALGLL